VLIDQSATMQVRLVDGGEAADAERLSLTADLSVLLLRRGRSALRFRLTLLSAALTLPGVLAGAPFGILGIAAGFGIAVIIGGLSYLAAAMREVRVGVRTLVVELAPTLTAATIMACGLAGLCRLLPEDLPVLVQLALAAGAGMLLYTSAMRVLAPDTLTAASPRADVRHTLRQSDGLHEGSERPREWRSTQPVL